MGYFHIIYFDENGKVWEVERFSDDHYTEYLATLESAKRRGYIVQYGYF